jgi:hypothetical protein
MARAFITAVVLALCAASMAAQGGGSSNSSASGGDLQALRARVERRFQILPVANGIVLTPRFNAATRSIEVLEGTIAVDGTPVTGAELRQKLGADADLILQLSYLDSASRRSLSGASITPPAPSGPGATTSSSEPGVFTPDVQRTDDSASRTPRTKRKESVVRIGGNVKVASDERVTDDVVVVGGSADIDGQVDGDVVVVGGSATLGPNADIRSDVTVVGGGLNQDPKALIGGSVQNVGFGDIPFGGDWGRRRDWSGWNPIGRFRPAARFMGTTVRVGLLMLFASIVMFIARAPVEQIAERAAAEPVKSWVVGFLAEILFVPALVLTVVILAISIIGIPLLLLIPVAIVGALLVFLVGFTGIAYHVGRLLQSRFDQLRTRPYAALTAGIALILSPLILARVVGLTGELGFIAGVLVAIGVIVEYIAWTTGLGAAALVRFSRPARPTVEVMPSGSSASV